MFGPDVVSSPASCPSWSFELDRACGSDAVPPTQGNGAETSAFMHELQNLREAAYEAKQNKEAAEADLKAAQIKAAVRTPCVWPLGCD